MAASSAASDVLIRVRDLVTESLARPAVAFRPLERALVAACRRPELRRLGAAAVAMAYPRVLRGREVRVADMGRYRFHVDVADFLGVGPYFFRDEYVSWITSQLVHQGDTCIDAGANVGHYTFFMASQVGPSGRIVAFEPNPPYAELVRRSIELNGFSGYVQLEQRALWDRSDETLEFYLSTNTQNSGTSSLVNHGLFLSPQHVTRVKTIRLDEFARERGLGRIRLAKIDVERAELWVLRGMGSLLREGQIEYLVLEMLAGSEADQYLREQGITAYLLDEKRRALVPVDRVPVDTFGDFLVVAPPSEREFRSQFGASIVRS